MQKIFAWLQTKKLHVLIQVVNRVFVVHILLLVQVVEPKIKKSKWVYPKLKLNLVQNNIDEKANQTYSFFLTFVAEIGSCYGGGC